MGIKLINVSESVHVMDNGKNLMQIKWKWKKIENTNIHVYASGRIYALTCTRQHIRNDVW